MPTQENRLRQRVADYLGAGISSEDILAALLRQGVPETQARAIIAAALGASAGAEDEARPPQVPPAEDRVSLGGDACGRHLSVETGLGDGKCLSAAKNTAPGLPAPIVKTGGEKAFRAPASAAGETVPTRPVPSFVRGTASAPLMLTREARRLLRRELTRDLWYLLVLVPPLVLLGGFFLVLSVVMGLAPGDPSELISSPPVLRDLPAFAHAVVTLPAMLLIFAGCVLGAGIQLASIGRCLGDLLPGRVLTLRTRLRQPADLSTRRKEFLSVGLVGSRRRYRLVGRWLYVRILRSGLERPYRIYYSPRTRWIWHLELAEQQ